MNIILFGPPGAGKGTQTDRLINEFKLFKVSAGDLLREEIKKKTSLGLEIKTKIDKGSLVSNNVIDNLIENKISNKSYHNSLIFDGYPRNLQQAKKLDIWLDKYSQSISCVLNLNVDNVTLIKRVLGRQICSKCGQIFNDYFNPASNPSHECGKKFLEKRSDDNEVTIKNRLQVHFQETQPVINYYKKLNLLTNIDGTMKIDEIYQQIRQIINTLRT